MSCTVQMRLKLKRKVQIEQVNKNTVFLDPIPKLPFKRLICSRSSKRCLLNAWLTLAKNKHEHIHQFRQLEKTTVTL